MLKETHLHPSNSFNTVAEDYETYTPHLPQAHDLFIQTFGIHKDSKVLDIASGSGELALALAQYTSYVSGLDSSEKMLTMADSKTKSRNLEGRVIWHRGSVEEFDLGSQQYDLITMCEAIHLVDDPIRLIQRCARALKPGGSFCIGWATYEWEMPAREKITEAFSSYEIPWDYAWTCPNFSTIITTASSELSLPQQKQVFMETHTHITTIANYLLSISYTSTLDPDIKATLYNDLEQKFRDLYPSGKAVGDSTYTLLYTTKLTTTAADQLSYQE